jgi:peroxiredoxin Q/BCP
VRDEQPAYLKHHVTTLGVNPASVASHEQYKAQFAFNFELVSDADRAIASAWGALKADGRGIQRTVYLVGTDGRIAFAQRGAPPADAILSPLG